LTHKSIHEEFMTTPTKHNRDGLLAVSSIFERNYAYILKQCYASVLWLAAKASITFSLYNSCVRSFSMASMATLWSFSLTQNS